MTARFNDKSNQSASGSLPLLEFTAELFKDISFNETLFICCIHLLKANIPLVEKLIKFGAKPEDILLLGKVYSTNQKSAEKIKNYGVYIHPASSIFDSYKSFDEVHYKAIAELVEMAKVKLKNTNYKKIVIVDDGGHLLETILKDKVFDHAKIHGVEWTSSGYNLLKDLSFDFPVINMARSKTKLTIESPMIAEADIRQLKRFFGYFSRKIQNILIIGGGAIGASISAELKEDHDVQTYDLITENSDFQREELSHILGNYDMIIGATGRTVLEPKHFSSLKRGVILVSTSSSDREFSAVELRKRVKEIQNPHEDVSVDGITLLNCGFPLPFDGSEVPVVLEKIQLTIALAFASIAQTYNSDGKGFIELNTQTQESIVNKYLELQSS